MSEPPKRKRRWYQFSLRSLLFVVVPYVAVYVLVLSSILSADGTPKPVANEWKIAEAIGTAIQEGIAKSMKENMAISFTVAWILLPILSWAIWRSSSRLRRRPRGVN